MLRITGTLLLVNTLFIADQILAQNLVSSADTA